MKFHLILVLFLIASVSFSLPDCDSTKENNLPLVTSEPKLIKETALGKKYLISDQSGENFVYVVQVRGSPK